MQMDEKGVRAPLLYSQHMRFAPEYVSAVLNENFEDAKTLLLEPLMAINYAHLVMLAECGIVRPADARTLRQALDAVPLDEVRQVRYDGTYEDLFFYVERLIEERVGPDVAGRLHTARSRNDLAMTMYRLWQRARIGQVAKVAWPNATTYLGPHPGVGRVMLRSGYIATPRHKQLPIRLINPREESRYQTVLEGERA